MNGQEFNEYVAQLRINKKLIQDLSIKRNEQLILCTTTVLVLLIGFHKDHHFLDTFYTWVYRIDLLLHTLSLAMQVTLLNQPLRTVRKSDSLYTQGKIQALREVSVNTNTTSKPNRMEKFSERMILPSFFLSMLGLLIMGMLLSF